MHVVYGKRTLFLFLRVFPGHPGSSRLIRARLIFHRFPWFVARVVLDWSNVVHFGVYCWRFARLLYVRLYGGLLSVDVVSPSVPGRLHTGRQQICGRSRRGFFLFTFCCRCGTALLVVILGVFLHIRCRFAPTCRHVFSVYVVTIVF